MTTPFFPALRCQLAALGRRSVQSLRQCTLHQLSQHLRDLLPAHLLSAQDEGPHSRQRCFSLALTFQCLLWQVLNHASCREVVRQVQALCRLHGRPVIDESDGAYVQARSRLPWERFEPLLAATAQAADRRAAGLGQLAGRPVKVIDATTVQLPDTPKNQKAYPQPREQKPGCGFPVMKLAALFSLASGAILDLVIDNLHAHDLRLFRRLWQALKPGDIALADRAFGDYATLAQLPKRRIDMVCRLHQRRRVDFRKGRRLGPQDSLFVWKRGDYRKTMTLSRQEWGQLPEQIQVRIIRFQARARGFRIRPITLTTTLLDGRLYPAEAIIALYARRWRLELCFRDLKTMMGMESLRCQSPEMARKELMAYLIAHNLVRCVMAQAASRHEVALDRISFKGTVDGLRQYSAAIAQARNAKKRRELWDDLLRNLAADLVPWRPEREEPRAVKKRPKNYPLLNRPRHKFKEIAHRNRYRKNNARKNKGLI